MQAVKCLKNVLSPLMVILKTFLVHILVGYGFVNTSSEGFGGKSQPIAQLLRIHIGFFCTEPS